DYKKLNKDILDLLVEKFPDGYDDSDIITFRNLKNEVIEAVEVRTEDTIYVVKVGTRLIQAMEDYGDEEDSNDRDSDASDEVEFDVKEDDKSKKSDEEEDDQDDDSDDDYDDKDEDDDYDDEDDNDEDFSDDDSEDDED